MSALRILMYCHDSYGLGHTGRALKVAGHITEKMPDCSILLLTDLQIIGRLKLPRNLDFVHVPGVAYSHNGRYQSSYLNIALKDAIKLRAKIVQSAAKTFKPNLVIVDRDPLALPQEMTRILSFVREKLPKTKIIWALLDVMGDTEQVATGWQSKSVRKILARLCDEIWVYGEKKIFDQRQEYRLASSIAEKLFYTSYLKAADASENPMPRDFAKLDGNRPSVLMTGGSGTGGYPLIDNYLTFLENAQDDHSLQSVIITGPMMPSEEKKRLKQRAEKLPNIVFHRFSKHFLEYMNQADLVIGTGGYNTLCEILSYRKKAIIVPDHVSMNGHYVRSKVFDTLGLVDFLSRKALNPNRLGVKILSSFSETSCRTRPSNSVSLDGLENILKRVKLLSSA